MTPYEALVEWLQAQGFRQSRAADRWGHEVWARKGVTATMTKHCSSTEAESVRVRCERDMTTTKRKPKTARRRDAAEKKAAANTRKQEELERLIALKNRELGGARAVLTSAEARAIEQTIAKWERELHQMQSLMTSIPGPRADAGRPRARHHS